MKCSRCGAETGDDEKVCEKCSEELLKDIQPLFDFMIDHLETCPDCDGQGCPSCQGEGLVPKEE